MKKTFVTLFVMLSMLWSMGTSAQTLVFHLADGTTADVELTSAFRMFTAGNKINVILPDGSTKDFTQSDILTITYRETRGDVNRDNAVDVADIATIINIMAGIAPEPAPIVVTTDDATNIEENQALLDAHVTFNIDITKKYTIGFFIATSGTPSSSNHIFDYPEEVEDKLSGWSQWVNRLSANTTYYYCAYVLYDGVYYYSDIKSFTTKSVTGYTSCPDSNHPHMIDLGLSSGTLWACCNVGATMPTEYGGHFAWGETQPKTVFTWQTYLYGSSKDNVENIGEDIAGTSYDAATANWKAPWRMPTINQWEELINKCTSTWTTLDGINGRKYTGSNGNSIFVPAAGYYSGSDFISGSGDYWSSTLYEYPFGAESVWFTEGGHNTRNGSMRNCGNSVRPVVGTMPASPRAVNMGFDSGVKWANMNVGASKPEDYGLYFAWGETKGYTADSYVGRSFNWASYKWCKGSFDSLTKYCTGSFYGTVDNKTVLSADDDAATQNWGTKWHMPTQEDIQELIDNTYYIMTTQNGVSGGLFTSKINGESIFIPCASFRLSAGYMSQYEGVDGRVWSSSLYMYSNEARSLHFGSGRYSSYDERIYGIPVRPVTYY